MVPALRSVLVATVALLLGACAGQLSDQLAAPEISLAGIGFGEPGLFEQKLRIDLRVRNPNDFTIDVERVRFELRVNDQDLTNGWTEDPFVLPALGQTIVPVTVYVPTVELFERVMALGSGKRLGYRLHGRVELDNLLVSSLPFERAGEIALPRLPEIPSRSPATP
jgi:LEA14-like dessication related protein